MRDGGEAQHGEGVLAPVHLLVGVHAAELVDEPLEGAQHRIEPGALALEHARQIDAHGTNRREQDDGVDGKLQPAIGGHVRISPGRAA